MKSNYKPIGDYIQRVESRNKDLKVTRLLGLSMTKEFRKTTSNTVGTNMTVYRVMSKYQFACDFMSPIRVNKLPVVLKLDDEPNLVSPAYPVFEIEDRNELDPEYLMMWFRRPEFDRYATFKCDAAIRGGYDWDALCETLIPVPTIEKQKKVVAEYNTIKNRIELNEQINQKLEETAQAIYKQWFVDFEFPNENGKPYKSSGGKMVYNEVLEKDIPVEWEAGSFNEFVRLSQGQVINAKTNHLLAKVGLPLLRITDLINDTQKQFINPELVNPKNIANVDDIIYSRTGQVGLVFRNKKGVVYNNCFKVIPIKETITKDYIYRLLKDKYIYNLMNELAAASAQPDLTHSAFFSVKVLMPTQKVQKHFSELIRQIEKYQEDNKFQIMKLTQFKDLLLCKLVTIEN